jgi:hypothetical protein
MPMSAEEPGYLYHYTEAAHADSIAEDEAFLVGGGVRFGPGLYATDLEPAEASDEEIRAACFEADGADPAFSGVLCLFHSPAFEEVEPRVFMIAAEEVGEVIPIEAILKGVGRRALGEDWEIEPWPP